MLCSEVESADLPTCFSYMKKPAAATDTLSQHMPRSATCMNNQAIYVPNRKTKQDLKKASYLQKAWPYSIKGNSAAAKFYECGKKIMCVICNKKINMKTPFVEIGRWKAHKETNTHFRLNEKRQGKKQK